MSQVDKNSIVVIDASVAGASGDKYLGALLDLGASKSRLERVAQVVTDCLPGTKKVDVYVSSVERGEIASKLVEVKSSETLNKRKGRVVASAIQKSSSSLGLSSWAQDFAESAIKTLLNAESQVHGRSSTDVELHELGSADTLVDILGTASLADELGLGGIECWSTPLPTGAGTSHFAGRDYPNPPPAVAEIFRAHKIPINPSEIEAELTTPTGAAITANLANRVSASYPAIRPLKIGYGAGSKEIGRAANILRITLGERVDTYHNHDEVVVLETNLDDVTGEVIGHAMEQLMLAGARDVTVTPVYMKKNRPGHLLAVIVDADRTEELSKIIMDETGTLGVREIPVRRHVSRRTETGRVVKIDGIEYPVKVKSSLDEHGNVLSEKVEFEDRKRLANESGKTLLEVSRRLGKRKEG